MASHYNALAKSLNAGTYKQCFDVKKGVMANTPEKNTFSQHASIMGVLSGSIPAEKVASVMHNLLQDTTLSQATFYYRFYLTQALKKANMADLYYAQLKPWRDMLEMGLTTFAENPEPTRSDCHAWSASPNYDLLATVCGIMPGSPHFSTVIVKPAMGELRQVAATMPHPDGIISVFLERVGVSGIRAEIVLPKTAKGKFIWNNKTLILKGGMQKVLL